MGSTYLFTLRDQVVAPRLYQMIKHVHTSMKDPAIGELILDDVQYFDKMLSSLEQYQIQSSNLAKLMRRVQEKRSNARNTAFWPVALAIFAI